MATPTTGLDSEARRDAARKARAEAARSPLQVAEDNLKAARAKRFEIRQVIWSLVNQKPYFSEKPFTVLVAVKKPGGDSTGRGGHTIFFKPYLTNGDKAMFPVWLIDYRARAKVTDSTILEYERRVQAEIAGARARQAGAVVPTTGDLPGDVTVNSLYKKVVRYNASSVKNAYLQGGNNILGSPARVVNTPKQVESANNLWADSNGYKGMIQMWVTPFDSDTSYTNPDTKQKSALLERYGFQFLYNPGTVTMQYRGVENMDVTMYTAGLAKTNLYPSGESLGTIAFDLLINRMADIPLYNSDGSFKPGMGPAQYPVKPRDEKEYQEIYNKGTMYDVEFLLRTLLGFGMKSDDWTNRNTLWDGSTADMGFVFPRPVELHLGKTMRYVVQISAFTLKHVIFDDRMVPLFTTISLACTRIPDYPSSVGDGN